jgi:5-methylcytosine-specific restriction protein A
VKKAKLFKSNTGGTGKKFAKKRMYETVEWVEFRNRFIQANSKCYACGCRAVIVDHIVSAKGDEGLFWNELNYIPLCKPDHDYISGKFDRYIPPRTEAKLIWINNKRLETGTAIKVQVVSLKK